MKKLFLFTGIAISLSLMSCGQTQVNSNKALEQPHKDTITAQPLTKEDSIRISKKNDWTNNKLNGKIKSIKLRTYQTIDKAGQIEVTSKTCVKNDGDNYDWVFNDKGFITEKKDYDTEANSIGYFSEGMKYDSHYRISEDIQESPGSGAGVGYYCYKNTFKYDANSNNVEQDFYNSCTSSQYSSKTTHIYDHKNELLADVYFQPDVKSRSMYTYDSTGRQVICVTRIVANGRVDSAINRFDAKHNLIELRISSTMSTINCTHTYKYDEHGNMTENVFEDQGTAHSYDSGDWTATFKYDEHGNLVETVAVYKNDALNNFKTSTKYEYDSTGNWTKATSTFYHAQEMLGDNANHEHTVVAIRDLKYF